MKINFLENILNFIFLPTCGICGKIGEGYLCNNCKKELINSNIFLNHLEIYNNKAIDEHFYLFSYKEPIREKILQYKFRNKAYLANTISEFFINNENLCRFLKKYDIMITIPISKYRKRERGYNQSDLIARKICTFYNINFNKKILTKTKNNTPQSGLNKNKRLENVKNVYKLQNEPKIKEKKILLFDDIYTTGATANECARILKQAGAKNVGILTVAKDF